MLDHVSLAYGHAPLLDEVSLQIESRERVSLIGRNGTGKSTLLQIISGERPPDTGSIWRRSGLRISRLVQDVPLSADRPVFDIVAEGLGDLSDLVTSYHHTAVEVAEQGSPALLAKLGSLQHELEERDGWRLEQRVEMVLARLGLPAEAVVDTLSGGWRRRTLLARALVGEPDLLLLDEPTNHLDIDSITWLESFIAEFAGAVVFVTHDRASLDNVVTSTLVFEGAGQVREYVGGYEDWLRQRAPATATIRERAEPRLAPERPAGRRKLSYNEERELEQLPARIEALEAEQRALSAAIVHPEFYRESAETIHAKLARMEMLPEELLQAYSRWHDLDSRSA